MRRAVVFLTVVGVAVACARAGEFRRLPVSEYRDRMKAGWIGQMAGVGWGGPTEFKWKGQIIPEDKVPQWSPGRINQFRQDDIYVEMTFLRSMEVHGLDVSIRQAGIDFANSGYPLWHANRAGRDLLRSGVAPPDSGHPKFNRHADDIDYQIEADYAGLIAPGLPNVAIAMGEKFGRLMNYGDGIYGGQFVGGMYAEAFFETDPVTIVEAGLACVPAKSQFAETIRDTLAWHKQNPDDWQKTWGLLNEKYHLNPAYRRYSCSGPKSAFNIDAKLNAAYIAMGLLYGEGDPDKTIVISTRCGQDSDCNPSNSGGVLFTTIGYAKLPERFTSALDNEGKFIHTPYTFPKLIDVCESLVRQAVAQAGGRIEKEADGHEVFVIPVLLPKPTPLEQCWEPGPVADSKFTPEEMAQITAKTPEPRSAKVDISKAVERFAPGWGVKNCGRDMNPGLRASYRGRKNVLLTHPLSRSVGCSLTRKVAVPAGKKTTLELVVTHHDRGDWDLIVKADGKPAHKATISKATAKDGWCTVAVDLSKWAGKEVALELVNQANGWSWEAAYWASIAVKSE